MRVIVILSAITLAGCSNFPYRVASKANDYIFFEDRFEKSCKDATKECVAQAQKLVECKKALVDAADAAKRGGAAKYQEKAMNAACKGFK